MGAIRTYTVFLPCRPYIRKYVAAKFGYPVPAYNKSTIGNFLQICLEKERYTERAYTDSFIHQNFTAALCIQVSAFVWVNYGFDFSTAKIVEINQFLKAMFFEHLHDWVEARNLPGTDRRYLIEEFAEMHGIELEEDISLDALVKKEYRIRRAILQRREKSLKAVQDEDKISAKLSAQKLTVPGNLFCKTVLSQN